MESWIEDLLPRVIPASWRIVERRLDGLYYAQDFTGLTIIVSGDTEQDGKRWLHLSVAHPSRMPTWTEVKDMRDWFLGRERKAIHVIPPESQHVNKHPYCLHVWFCADGDLLPDFTRGTGSL